MSYSLATLWYERQRLLPAVLAVSFSAVLVALQFGLLLGTFSIVSMPVDHTKADLWIGAPGVVSVDVSRPIPDAWAARLSLPEVKDFEPFVESFTYWYKPTGGTELCIIVGSRLGPGSLGAMQELTPELRAKLAEPGAVVVDESDRERLGLRQGIGELAEVAGRRVRVVGMVQGLKGLAGPYVFCSLETARTLLGMRTDEAVYLLARCHHREDTAAAVERLKRYPDMAVFSSPDFSLRSRWHWLVKTGAGVSLGCAALLGLLVGAVVTSQTLYAATVASLRELAVLRAMGIPRWRMAASVLTQSFWVGVIGIGLAGPAVLGLAQAAGLLGARVQLPGLLLGGAAAVTMVMALLSGLAALRSLRLIEPAALLR
jgi:putative ABC transport system permease protein